MNQTLTYTLIRTDFDNLENQVSAALQSKVLGVFVDTPEKTVHRKCSEYLRNLPPVNLYLGHDGQVYPQFTIKQIYAD